MGTSFLESVKKQFLYYKMLGNSAFEQLSEEELFWRFNSESNSIATIVKHLCGNMLSRWTDFLTTDGEKDWRNRDAEFEDGLETKEAVLKKWDTGWACLLNTLDTLNTADLDKVIYIRNQGHTVMEAIIRQLAHYPYHIGQIVYIAKMIKDKNWKSLSIPKGSSKSYNSAKFAQQKAKNPLY